MRDGTQSSYRGGMAQVTQSPERVETLIIGGGQAGLSVGYHLARRHRPFLILDAHARVGDSWRQRWDSLRLFTSARWDGLDGMPFPAPPHSFPTKDAMADYLEAYAAHFKLPIRHGERVEQLRRQGRHYLVTTRTHTYEAEHVVVAMANYQVPRLPAFSAQLNTDIVQIHSMDYRRPSQLRAGNILIVGAGNSGAEIAMDLAPHHHILMSGRDTGQVPFKVDGLPARLFLLRLVFRLLFHRVFTIRTPLGRTLRGRVISKGGPLIRTKQQDLAAVGVERVPRVTGVRDGSPLLEDGRVVDVANVVWCSGFTPAFSWIHLPVLDSHGEPVHDGGVVRSEPGLYFVGLHFLYAFSSTMIHGVGRDADRIAGVIATRVADTPAHRVQPAWSNGAGAVEARPEAIR
jgi:putative flavoprotein involved in K+ transport